MQLHSHSKVQLEHMSSCLNIACRVVLVAMHTALVFLSASVVTHCFGTL
jgi:hypothetical protein